MILNSHNLHIETFEAKNTFLNDKKSLEDKDDNLTKMLQEENFEIEALIKNKVNKDDESKLK
jgi:hypothetical protein